MFNLQTVNDMEGFDSTKGGFNGTILPAGGQGGGTSFEDLGYSTFDKTEAYRAGDVVIYDGLLYKFTAFHSGDWTGDDVNPTSVAESIEGVKHPYISLERLREHLYRVTFNSIPKDDGGRAQVVGGCSAFVKDGKLFRNFDFKYDDAASFIVRTRDFEGMAMMTGLDDDTMDDEMIAQLPYHIVDGRNNDGIMVSVHVLFNDWEYTGAGDKSIPMMRLPYEVLTRVKSMDTIATDLAGVLGNLEVTAGMGDYLLQCLVTDGTTTYAIVPPTSDNQSYTFVEATSYPKMTNFLYVARANVSRNDMDMQDRPTGVERFNAIPCDLEDLRFTKAYENTDRLSEFIGIDGTTKSSTDEELTAIYEEARAEYLVRQRDGKTWHTMHSVVYGDKMESLHIQENWGDEIIGQGGGGGSTCSIVSVTWSELKALRDNGKLTAATNYRIIDYVTTTAQEDTQSAGHQFDIIVTALNSNKLLEEARAVQHEEDTYFSGSRLNAWKLKYNLDNDTNTFTWADEDNGKGVIYYMKDEFGNECPYDFKNIMFVDDDENVAYYTFNNETEQGVQDFSLNHVNCHGNVIEKSLDMNTGLQMLCNNVVLSCHNWYCINNKIGPNCFNNKFGYNCVNNVLGADCIDNKFGDNCKNNKLGIGSIGNTFGDNCEANELNEKCKRNYFDDSCKRNKLGSECNGNSFAEECYNNTLASSCSNNSFDSSCRNNAFLSGCSSNTIGTLCQANVFGVGCNNISLSSYCFGNKFGNICSGITLGNNCSYNSFGNFCFDIKFGKSQTVNDYYRNNIVDNGCNYIYLDTDQETSSEAYLQNVHVCQGVRGDASQESYLTIDIDVVGQDYQIEYKASNSVTNIV